MPKTILSLILVWSAFYSTITATASGNDKRLSAYGMVNSPMAAAQVSHPVAPLSSNSHGNTDRSHQAMAALPSPVAPRTAEAATMTEPVVAPAVVEPELTLREKEINNLLEFIKIKSPMYAGMMEKTGSYSGYIIGQAGMMIGYKMERAADVIMLALNGLSQENFDRFRSVISITNDLNQFVTLICTGPINPKDLIERIGQWGKNGMS